jgi:hypothetical protein
MVSLIIQSKSYGEICLTKFPNKQPFLKNLLETYYTTSERTPDKNFSTGPLIA